MLTIEELIGGGCVLGLHSIAIMEAMPCSTSLLSSYM